MQCQKKLVLAYYKFLYPLYPVLRKKGCGIHLIGWDSENC